MVSLQYKHVLLTGASRGLGRELAQQLADAGANISLVARDSIALEESIHQTLNRRVSNDQGLQGYCADLSDLEQVHTVWSACVANQGPVDILINNAAQQGPVGAFDDIPWQAWQNVFNVNLFAAARLCQLCIPGMRSKSYGKIINLSGGGATGPRPDLSAYAAAKCALVRLSETLAEELRDSHIDVNCVAPGAMNTRMLDELLAAGPDGARHEYERALKQAQHGGTSPAQGAQLILFLASAASDGITGRLLSAVWDDWANLPDKREQLANSDIYTLRRIVPEDRGQSF